MITTQKRRSHELLISELAGRGRAGERAWGMAILAMSGRVISVLLSGLESCIAGIQFCQISTRFVIFAI
jgi:hypothetical protein